MNRQQAKELLPIIQAFAEGKTIQFRCSGEDETSCWEDIGPDEAVGFSDDTSKYRIKPEPKYRPFVDKEECWNEMLKHQPFGWVKAYYGQFVITEIRDSKATIGRNDRLLDFDYIFSNYKFADGTPFGIKI